MKYSLIISLLLISSVSHAQMNAGSGPGNSSGAGVNNQNSIGGVSSTGIGVSTTGQPIGTTNGGNVVNPNPNTSVTAPIAPSAGSLNSNPSIPNINTNTIRKNRMRSSATPTTSAQCTTSTGVNLTQSDAGYTSCLNAAQNRR